MANVIQEPAARPQAVLGNSTTPNPIVTFHKDDVAFAYGGKWKRRYSINGRDNYFVFPAQWDVRNCIWRRYCVEPRTDWWTDHCPADQMQRLTGPLCDGYHLVNDDIKTRTVTKWNVGCEKFHGAPIVSTWSIRWSQRSRIPRNWKAHVPVGSGLAIA